MGYGTRRTGYSSLFQPDVILPSQFAGHRGAQAHGERHLMMAILEDAINCYRDYMLATRESDRRLFREAEEWIMAEDQGAPFSFKEICLVLGIDPEYVRDGLKRWRQREFKVERDERVKGSHANSRPRQGRGSAREFGLPS
jgi:hypothetical protein